MPETATQERDSLADEFLDAMRGSGFTREEANELAQIVNERERAIDGVTSITELRIVSMFREMSRAAIEATHPRRELRVQWIALGWADVAQESMRRIARDYGVTPEAISKMVASYQERFRLPKNLFNKSAASSKVYAETNRPRARACIA